ncbi:hypothetical protein Hdeb2414_s0026g00680521 [Helianthus debilis subsp. tardiflorus]|nr:hypothetical protein HanLR1_Chr00c0023g0693271 [Helianthus annuus]
MLNLTFEVPAKLKSRREVINCLNSAVVSETDAECNNHMSRHLIHLIPMVVRVLIDSIQLRDSSTTMQEMNTCKFVGF